MLNFDDLCEAITFLHNQMQESLGPAKKKETEEGNDSQAGKEEAEGQGESGSGFAFGELEPSDLSAVSTLSLTCAGSDRAPEVEAALARASMQPRGESEGAGEEGESKEDGWEPQVAAVRDAAGTLCAYTTVSLISTTTTMFS